jgi:small subunit ribosomal protein S6
MLDPGQDAPARDALAKEARGQIEASGTLKHENTWGLRKLAFEIEQRTEADYRWFRFEASTELLEQLDHNLKIADGVLRFRIFKVDPAAPVIVPPATGAAPSRGRADDGDAPEAVVNEEQDAPEPAAVAAAPLEAAPESAPEVPIEAPADDSADAAE